MKDRITHLTIFNIVRHHKDDKKSGLVNAVETDVKLVT